MTQRHRFWIALAAGFLCIAGVIGVSAQGDDSVQLNAAANDATTTTVEETTTTVETTTTAVAPTTTTAKRRPSIVSTILSTLPLKPLTLNRVRITVGTPCRDETTTTTGNGGGIFEMDGCWLFVYWPVEETEVHVRVLSNRGLNASTISGPCQTYEGECHAYIGPVFDRHAGDRECFWLVTTDIGWVPLSNQVCVVWPNRPEIAQSPA
jgi:hypothetical protein